MKGKLIQDADRCQVGRTKDGKYCVWHKVMGKGSQSKFVLREKVLDTVDELLNEFDETKKSS